MKIEIDHCGREQWRELIDSVDMFYVSSHVISYQDNSIKLEINGTFKPKKQAIKDLGKAVNWFNSHWIWSEQSDQYINTNGTIKNSFWYIRQVCFGKEELPEWWPDELTE